MSERRSWGNIKHTHKTKSNNAESNNEGVVWSENHTGEDGEKGNTAFNCLDEDSKICVCLCVYTVSAVESQ